MDNRIRLTRPVKMGGQLVVFGLIAVVLGGCQIPFTGASAGVQFQGTLGVNNHGCLVLRSGDLTFPFVPPSSDGRAPPDGAVELPDGQHVQVGDNITTNGVSWTLSSRPEGKAIAERCGYELTEEAAEPTG
jgi:hypothetical protein